MESRKIKNEITRDTIKKYIYYIVIFLASLFFIDRIPLGAIASLSAVIAANHIALPAIILNIIGISIISPISTLIYLVFATLFIFLSIIIKPLVSIENRNEKKKLGNYTWSIMLIILIRYYGLFPSIGISMIVYSLYKILVNSLSILKNEDGRKIFSKDEKMSVYLTVLLLELLIISLIPEIKKFNYLMIVPIISLLAIKLGLLESLTISLIIYGLSIFIPNAGLNVYLMITIPVLFSLLGIFEKRSVVIILALLNIFMLVIYNDEISTYLIFAVSSLIVLSRYKKNNVFDLLGTELTLGNEGERRLTYNLNEVMNNQKKENDENISLEENKDDLIDNFDDDDNLISTEAKLKYAKIYRNELGRILDVYVFSNKEQEELEAEKSNNEKDNKENKNKENKKEKIKEEEQEEIRKVKIQKEKIKIRENELYSSQENINGFKKYFIENTSAKKLDIYDEIIFYDNILKEVYLSIIKNDYNKLEYKDIKEILENNNIIIIDEEKATNNEKENNLVYNILNELGLEYIEKNREQILNLAEEELVIARIRKYDKNNKHYNKENIKEIYKRI